MIASSASTADQPCFAAQNTATQPATTATQPHNTATQPRSRRRWTPSDNDHLIYHWVKMEGRTQDWVARAFDIHQSTVSRIIERYERWQAHAKERENGRLDPSERLRAQRWLTFERNELILASCLRIAHEMEGFCDVSQSVTTYNHKDPTKQADVRTVHSVLDRHGIAARFLRLAHRINMEQVKLAELDQPPPARELTDEEFAAEERQAAADAAEFAAAQAASRARVAASMSRAGACGSRSVPQPDLATRVPTGSAPPRGSSLAESSATLQPAESEPAASPTRQEPRDTGFPGGNLGTSDALSAVGEAHPTTHHSPTHHSPDSTHDTHNLHTENVPEIAVSHAAPCTCVLELTAEKIAYKPCIIDHGQQQRPAENPLPNRLPTTPDTIQAANCEVQPAAIE
jgi:hypothetical protein